MGSDKGSDTSLILAQDGKVLPTAQLKAPMPRVAAPKPSAPIKK